MTTQAFIKSSWEVDSLLGNTYVAFDGGKPNYYID